MSFSSLKCDLYVFTHKLYDATLARSWPVAEVPSSDNNQRSFLYIYSYFYTRFISKNNPSVGSCHRITLRELTHFFVDCCVFGGLFFVSLCLVRKKSKHITSLHGPNRLVLLSAFRKNQAIKKINMTSVEHRASLVKESNGLNVVEKSAIGVTATGASICASSAAVNAVGFKSAGILAGSAAAKFMSGYGGLVPAGSTCSLLQSAGATGVLSTIGLTVVGTGVGVGAGAIAYRNRDVIVPKAECGREEACR